MNIDEVTGLFVALAKAFAHGNNRLHILAAHLLNAIGTDRFCWILLRSAVGTKITPNDAFEKFKVHLKLLHYRHP